MQIDIQTPIDEEHTIVQYAVYTVPVSQDRNYVTKVLLRMLELICLEYIFLNYDRFKEKLKSFLSYNYCACDNTAKL